MRKVFSFATALLALATSTSGVAAQGQQSGSAFSFDFTAINGQPMPLDQYRGKVLLVVNTASFCGFTPQYEGLQALWEKYKDRGLVVLGVPSNDFGEQEPGTASEIGAFCKGQFGVTFPLTEKSVVRGEGAHPFYKWAYEASGRKSAPGWNFHKYLVSRDGRLVAWFPTAIKPQSRAVTDKIEAELEKPIS
jgi:glutathione peroxidase